MKIFKTFLDAGQPHIL